MEGLRDVRGRELDDHLLAALGGVRGVAQPEVGVEAEGAAVLEDRRDHEGGEWRRFEEELHVAVFDDGGLHERGFGELGLGSKVVVSF